MDNDKRCYIALTFHLVMKWWLFSINLIWFHKCYKLVKWVLFIIFNHISTHIVPNLKVPPLPNYPWGTKKMDSLVRLKHFYIIYMLLKLEYCMQWQYVRYLSIINLILSCCGWPNIIRFGLRTKNLLNPLHELYKYVILRWEEGIINNTFFFWILSKMWHAIALKLE